jgi:hypothetical protein
VKLYYTIYNQDNMEIAEAAADLTVPMVKTAER